MKTDFVHLNKENYLSVYVVGNKCRYKITTVQEGTLRLFNVQEFTLGDELCDFYYRDIDADLQRGVNAHHVDLNKLSPNASNMLFPESNALYNFLLVKQGELDTFASDYKKAQLQVKRVLDFLAENDVSVFERFYRDSDFNIFPSNNFISKISYEPVFTNYEFEHGYGLKQYERISPDYKLVYTQILEPETIFDLVNFLIFKMLENNVYIKRCKNCGLYFATYGKNYNYCNRFFKVGKACRDQGIYNTYNKAKNRSEVKKLYNAYYNRQNTRYRTGKKNPITHDEFLQLTANARKARDLVENGKYTIDDFKKFLGGDFEAIDINSNE